jgi:hypothetical protein
MRALIWHRTYNIAQRAAGALNRQPQDILNTFEQFRVKDGKFDPLTGDAPLWPTGTRWNFQDAAKEMIFGKPPPTITKQQYDLLPVGSPYVAPDGQILTKGAQ